MLAFRDDELEPLIEEMADRHGTSQSTIVRLLIQRGLQSFEADRRHAVINAKLDALVDAMNTDEDRIRRDTEEYLATIRTREAELSAATIDRGIDEISSQEEASRVPVMPGDEIEPSRLDRNADADSTDSTGDDTDAATKS